MKTESNSLTVNPDKISEWSDMLVLLKKNVHPLITYRAQEPPVHKIESHTHLGINFQSDLG